MGASGVRQTLSGNGQTVPRGTIGPVRVSLTGTFGTGSAQLEATDPEGNWVAVDGGVFTAVTDTIFDFPDHVQNQLRINLTGATGPALVVWIQSTLDR